MRASSSAVAAWDAQATARIDPSADPERLAPGWRIATAVAAGLVALGAPTSIFVLQAGIFTCLALALVHPRLALRPLARHPQIGGALAFYFLVQLSSIVYSQHPLRSLICLRGDWPVLYLPILLAALQVRAARRVAWVAVLIAASAAGLIGLVQHLTGADPLGRAVLEADGSGRFHAIGSLRGHLTYGGVMLTGFAAAFALLLTVPGRRRLVLLLVTAACGIGVVTSYARSALLGALMGAVVATVAALAAGRGGRGHRLRALLPAALIVAGGALLIALMPGLQARLVGLGDFSSDPRPRLWGTALRIFSDFPLLGAGLGAFKSHFPLYRLPGDYMATGHPHSDVLNVLAHSGLAGLLAWLALWWAVLRAAASAGRGVLAAGLLAAFLVGGLAQCYFTDEEPAAMLWLLLALAIGEGGGAAAANAASVRGRAGRRGRLNRLERSAKRALLPLAALAFLPGGRRRPPGPSAILPQARRILLIRQDNRLGNLVLITPFLQALRAAAPGAHIGLLAGSRFAAVLAGAPWFDELLLMHKQRLIRRPWTYPAHLAAIRSGRWDIAIDLSNPDTHSFYSAFVPLVSGAPWRVGFDHPLSRPALSGVVPPPERECHYSLAPLLLLSALGAEPERHPLRLSPALLERAGASAAAAPGKPSGPVVVHPGGRGAKQWPPEAFAAVARRLTGEGGGPVRVIGSQDDQALLAYLAGELPGAEVRTIGDLDGLVAALAGARLYIGCDAGPLHVAAALRVPALALFLSSHPLRYGPLGERDLTLVLGDRSRAWLAEAARTRDSLADADLTADSPAEAARTADSPVPAVPAEAPERGPRRLTPAPELARALAACRPRIVVAPDGLGLAGQIDLVCAQAEQMTRTEQRAPTASGPAVPHSPLEPHRASAEDHRVPSGPRSGDGAAVASASPDGPSAEGGRGAGERDRT